MLDASALDSWQTLAERLRSFIGRRLPSQDVDDVLQDVLLRIHRSAKDVRDESRFGPWVYSIARNAVIDHVRRRPIASLESDHPEFESAAVEQNGAPLLDCVAPFVARLPAPYRHAITLVELEGLTQAEAARMVGISLSGMKSRVQRGRQMMRTMFEECCTLAIDARGRVFDAERQGSVVCDSCAEPSGQGQSCSNPGGAVVPRRD